MNTINLNYTKVEDALANLKVLYLGYTNVVDVTALGKCLELEELYLSGSKVYDVSGTQLQKLELSHTSDITALGKCSKLQTLHLVFGMKSVGTNQRSRIYKTS